MYMVINGLMWNDFNIQHTNKHKISQNEVNELLLNVYIITLEYKERFVLYGTTFAGRLLTAVLEPRDNDFYYVVTACDMSARQRKFYTKEVSDDE